MKLIWGQHVWKALHYISLGYPDNPSEQQKQDYKQFFLLLKTTLPCIICRNHYEENLKELPLTDEVLKNKTNLIKWVIDLHNIDNKLKGYPILSVDNALENINKYKNHNYIDHIEYSKLIIIILLLILIILLFIILLKIIFKK